MVTIECFSKHTSVVRVRYFFFRINVKCAKPFAQSTILYFIYANSVMYSELHYIQTENVGISKMWVQNLSFLQIHKNMSRAPTISKSCSNPITLDYVKGILSVIQSRTKATRSINDHSGTKLVKQKAECEQFKTVFPQARMS